MAIRNTPWARHFFKEVARLGRLDDHHKGKNTLSKVDIKLILLGTLSTSDIYLLANALFDTWCCMHMGSPNNLLALQQLPVCMQILLKELQADAYSDGLRDQNAVIYLLKTHPEWQDRVLFQDKEICLNCYWQDLIGVTGYGKPEYDRVENVSYHSCRILLILFLTDLLHLHARGLLRRLKISWA